jgi:transglutaminase-like putative cysteine protease
MRYRLRHTTTYAYTYPVSVCHNALRLTPRECHHQRCSFHELLIYPEPMFVRQTTDYFGNMVTFFALDEPHDALTMTANSTVEVTTTDSPEPGATPPWEQVRDVLRHDPKGPVLKAYQYVFDSPYVSVESEMLAYAQPSFPPGRPLFDAVYDLTQRIYTEFKYDQDVTSVETPLREVLHNRHGVCQDFAHLQIACLRSLGLAARYVSGYLVTAPPPDQAPLVGALASHAWVSVYCPGPGWIDVDPTNNLLPSDGHITVAYGRDYGDVSPIKGVFLGGGEHTLEVSVDVTPLLS